MGRDGLWSCTQASINNSIRGLMGVPNTMNVNPCAVQGCEQNADAVIDGQAFCRDHFISHCYSQLERFDEMQKTHRLNIPDAEAVRRFINQSSRQPDATYHTKHALPHLDQPPLPH